MKLDLSKVNKKNLTQLLKELGLLLLLLLKELLDIVIFANTTWRIYKKFIKTSCIGIWIGRVRRASVDIGIFAYL